VSTPNLQNIPPPGDAHRYTVYHNEDFQLWMDGLHGDGWRDWPFKKVRMHAKMWNFASLYGCRPERMIKISESIDTSDVERQLHEWFRKESERRG